MYLSQMRPVLIMGRKAVHGNQVLIAVVHCRKKIGDVLIVSEQVRIIYRSLGIRIAQFVVH